MSKLRYDSKQSHLNFASSYLFLLAFIFRLSHLRRSYEALDMIKLLDRRYDVKYAKNSQLPSMSQILSNFIFKPYNFPPNTTKNY